MTQQRSIESFEDALRVRCKLVEGDKFDCTIERNDHEDIHLPETSAAHFFDTDGHLYTDGTFIISRGGWQGGETMQCTRSIDAISCQR